MNNHESYVTEQVNSYVLKNQTKIEKAIVGNDLSDCFELSLDISSLEHNFGSLCEKGLIDRETIVRIQALIIVLQGKINSAEPTAQQSVYLGLVKPKLAFLLSALNAFLEAMQGDTIHAATWVAESISSRSISEWENAMFELLSKFIISNHRQGEIIGKDNVSYVNPEQNWDEVRWGANWPTATGNLLVDPTLLAA